MTNLNEIKKYLDDCENPLILFDDDSDGLASFLLLYKYMERGRGIVVTHNILDESYVKKVEEYKPDLVVVLDKHKIEQDFVDKVNVPIIWIDHHPLVKINGVKYFNPKIYGKKDLVNYNIKEPFDALFNTKIGTLAKLFTFILKGNASEVKKCINILTRVNNPYEILNKTTPRGKYIYERFEKINREYQRILQDALKNSISTKNILLYTYYAKEMSLSQILSNELIYKFKDKVIIVARQKDDRIRMSLRTHYKSKVILPPLVKKAIEGQKGTSGGHDHACGGDIDKEDFKTFVDRLEHLIKK